MIFFRLRQLLVCALLTLLPTMLGAAEETHTVMGDQTIKVLYFEPDSGTGNPPLAILLSGGAHDEFMVRAQFWMGKEMVDRGWAVAMPISPGGRDYFVENGQMFPDLIADLRRIHSLQSGKTLLVGISSGGTAALAIATQRPEQYRGVVATPGRMAEDIALPALAGLPVYLRIGARDDFRWNTQLEQFSATLSAAGARVDAALVPEARHIFPLDWDELESWLGSTEP